MLLVVLFWAGNFTVMKIGFTELPPLAFNAIRFSLASVVLWAIVRRVEGSHPLPRGTLGPLIWLGLIGNTIYQLCFAEGIAHTSATKSALILAGMPAVVTLAAWAFKIEPVTVRQRWAVLLATVGVLVVVFGRGGSIDGGLTMGDLLLLGAVLTWAVYTLLLRHWQLPMSSLRLTAWITYTGTPGLILVGIPDLRRTDWAAVSFAGWGGVTYAAVLSLVLAYMLWNRGVAKLGASRTVVYNTLVPLLATVIAMVGLGERPGLVHVVGGALIIGGVLLTGMATAPEG
jgi:drug/metabolite transporter (DMT)-like permease